MDAVVESSRSSARSASALTLALRLAAGRAPLGLVLIAERLMQFLLGNRVRKVLTALDAFQRLVRERRHTGFPFQTDSRSPYVNPARPPPFASGGRKNENARRPPLKADRGLTFR